MWSIDSLSRAPRWPSQGLLLKGRMNFLTIRGQAVSRLTIAFGPSAYKPPDAFLAFAAHTTGEIYQKKLLPALMTVLEWPFSLSAQEEI